jgi:hypothetical protein
VAAEIAAWPAEQTTLMVNHLIDDKGFIWVGDAPTSRLIKFDQNGNYLYSWGAPGGPAGRLGCSHGITTDQAGNLYLADCFMGRVQKFEPIPGADPDKLVGQIQRTWDTSRPAPTELARLQAQGSWLTVGREAHIDSTVRCVSHES